MKALRFHGAKDVRLDEVEEPICGAGQVKIRPKFVGICGTDLHEYLAGPLLTPRTPHALTKESIPVTLGHEFSGVVEEVGDGVEDIRSGDQVVVFPTLYDGTCDACLRGYENCCTSLGAVGFTGWGGGLSEHVVLPRNHVYALPKNVPLDIGALIEPLSVAWHAVKASSFKPDDYVLILGGGPIGLGILQVLKAQKAQHVIVSEVAPGRKEFATQFGADLVLDPREDGLISRCKDYCEERGPDIVFDAAGVQEGLDLAIRVSRVGATIVNIAAWERPATINPMEMIIGEKKYVGTMTYVRRDFEEVLDAVASGLLQPGKMITGRISLDRVEEDGLKALIRDKDKNVKILVEI